MDYEKIAQKIKRHIDGHPGEVTAHRDLLDICRSWEAEDFTGAHDMNQELRRLTALAMGRAGILEGPELYDVWQKALLFDAPYDFDTFMLYIELDRPPEKRFYQPRRHYLRPMVEAYQEVADGKLQLLTNSMPKRAGKSQMGINFVNFLSGRRPDRATLMEGTGDDLVKSFYDGCLEYLLTPSEYRYYDVFPEAVLIGTKADLKTINLEKRKRFPTIMCRSIDARQVGLSEATNLLYMDDCVEGRKEASNRERLDEKWDIIRGDIMGRAIEGTPFVFTGTRYSIYDPIGRVQEHAKEQGWTWKAIEIPALDPVTDESNYEYERDGKKVFSTDYFREQRSLLSEEQWASEFQQVPFEARGRLFPKDDLNYFTELPIDHDPDAIIAACDTADKGSDSTSMPVAAIYGTEVYVIDVVHDNSPADVTKPECAAVLVKNHASNVTFESNNAGDYFGRDVGEIIKKNGKVCGIRLKRNVANKNTRIEMAADNIKKHFWFRHPSTYARNSQYAAWMEELTTYVRTGKVPHDDAPDSAALLESEVRLLGGTKPEVMRRPC